MISLVKNKMKPLELNYRIFIWLCICSSNSENRWHNIRNITFTTVVMIIFIATLISSALFCRKYIENDLEVALYSILQMITTITQIYTCIAGFLSRKRITEVFSSYKTFCDERKLIIIEYLIT